MMTLENSKTTSKTSSLKALLLRAWKDRWTDLQWGINIKTILPRGVSGDVYNLADCMLQHAVIGAGANQLVLSYLQHTLSCQMVSYAAVLLKISKFDEFTKPHCLISLLEFLESIQPGITCRNKAEEDLLASAVFSIVHWLLQIYHYSLCSFVLPSSQDSVQSKIEFPELLEKPTSILENFVSCDFMMALMYLAKHDDENLHMKIIKKCNEINSMITLAGTQYNIDSSITDTLQKLCKLDAVPRLMESDEPITYCIQALLTVDVIISPCSDTPVYVNQLQMIQSFKGYTNARLYCELIRACLISLHDVKDTARESMWGAFTFLKVPEIIEQLNAPFKEKKDFSPDVVSAFEQLLQYTSLLDQMDTESSCNIVEYLLGEMLKHRLVNETQVKSFTAARSPRSEILMSLDTSKTSSIPTVISRAEPILAGISKALKADCINLAEALLCMLCQVLTGKSFELILAVATMQGTLKQFVTDLIKCNESSKQLCGEVGKSAQTKMLLFDVSFLMLCSIVQTYGSETVLEENGDSFFEEWVRVCMVERFKPKSPDQMIEHCDHSKVESLLIQFNTGDSDFKNNQMKWSNVCMHIGAAVQEVLWAWEQGSLSPTDVKRILDAMRGRMCSLTVCAAAWLCSYMQIVHQDALLKPMNMVQQFLTTLTNDEMAMADNFKERSGLMFQIIKKMQYDVHPTTMSKAKVLNMPHSIISPKPICEQLQNAWGDIQRHGWLHVEATLTLESLLNTGGCQWFVANILNEVLKQKYPENLNKCVDWAFAIFNISLEKCTLAFLLKVLPQYLHNSQQSEDLMEPQSSALAQLTVYCILATLNLQENSSDHNLKRNRQDVEMNDMELLGSSSKSRRLNDGCAELMNTMFPAIGIQQQKTTGSLAEPLLTAVQELFKSFTLLVGHKGHITKQTHFIMKFFHYLVLCGRDKSKIILQMMPNTLIPSLVRTLPKFFSTTLILQLYDINTAVGRNATARDLCLLRNMQLRNNTLV